MKPKRTEPASDDEHGKLIRAAERDKLIRHAIDLARAVYETYLADPSHEEDPAQGLTKDDLATIFDTAYGEILSDLKNRRVPLGKVANLHQRTTRALQKVMNRVLLQDRSYLLSDENLKGDLLIACQCLGPGGGTFDDIVGKYDQHLRARRHVGLNLLVHLKTIRAQLEMLVEEGTIERKDDRYFFVVGGGRDDQAPNSEAGELAVLRWKMACLARTLTSTLRAMRTDPTTGATRAPSRVSMRVATLCADPDFVQAAMSDLDQRCSHWAAEWETKAFASNSKEHLEPFVVVYSLALGAEHLG